MADPTENLTLVGWAVEDRDPESGETWWDDVREDRELAAFWARDGLAPDSATPTTGRIRPLYAGEPIDVREEPDGD